MIRKDDEDFASRGSSQSNYHYRIPKAQENRPLYENSRSLLSTISLLPNLNNTILQTGSFFRRSSPSPAEKEITPKNSFEITFPIQHGIIIDAGSGGSRLHIYEWAGRKFTTIPPPLSFPMTSSIWTDRMKPGISSYANNPMDVAKALNPLMEFAKESLAGKEKDFKNYPIYLKATAGMRALPLQIREDLMTEIRNFMSNKTSCPFYFEHDFARVVSGEEEGIYAWAAVNFLQGNLLPALSGSGTVDADRSCGAIDLGGSSMQIAFFVPNQDVLEHIYKYQHLFLHQHIDRYQQLHKYQH